MGTKNTIIQKMDFIKFHLKKSAEKEKGINKSELIGRLMIAHNCSRRYAVDLINAFIDSGECKEAGEDLYGR